MSDRTLDNLRACIAALENVVASAVKASADQLAQEQVKLVAKYLGFLAERLDYAEAHARSELRCYLEMATEVDAHLEQAGLPDPALKAAQENGHAILAAGFAPKPQIETAARDLQAAVSSLVRALGQSGHPIRRAVEKSVLLGSRKMVTIQRAWLAPQGWEAAGMAPDIDEVIQG